MNLRLIFPIISTIVVSLLIVLPISIPRDSIIDHQAEMVNEHEIQFSVNNQKTMKLKIFRTEIVHEAQLFYVNLWLGEARADRLTFVLKEEEVKEGTYLLNNLNTRYLSMTYQSHQCTFRSDNYYTGVLKIHRYDRQDSVLIGSFEFVAFSEDCSQLIQVKNGRFNTGHGVHS